MLFYLVVAINVVAVIVHGDHGQGRRQRCGAGAESRRAEIKLAPGAGAEITNCGSSGSFLFITDFKNFYGIISWLLKTCL